MRSAPGKRKTGKTGAAVNRGFGRVDDRTWAAILACVPEDKSQVEFFTEAVFAYAKQTRPAKARAEQQRKAIKALEQAASAIDRARKAYGS